MNRELSPEDARMVEFLRSLQAEREARKAAWRLLCEQDPEKRTPAEREAYGAARDAMMIASDDFRREAVRCLPRLLALAEGRP